MVFCAKEKFREALAEALDQGHLREVASPIRTEGTVQRPAPAPRLGQHTDEMLAGLLGYPPAKIAALRASGALGGATAPSAPSAT